MNPQDLIICLNEHLDIEVSFIIIQSLFSRQVCYCCLYYYYYKDDKIHNYCHKCTTDKQSIKYM